MPDRGTCSATPEMAISAGMSVVTRAARTVAFPIRQPTGTLCLQSHPNTAKASEPCASLLPTP